MSRPRSLDAEHGYGGDVSSSSVAWVGKTWLDAPNVGIRWDRQWVALEMRDRGSSAAFRDAMEVCLRAVEETATTRLLLDLRRMRLVLPDDERWLALDFLPRLGANQLRWMGIVTPENELARVIVADLARPRPTGTESKHCATLRDATEWLSHTGLRQGS